VTKKICESLKATTDTRWLRVGHIFGIPSVSSELTSLVCRVQEKFAEEAIHSIHSNSTAKASKTDQDGDFATERKNLKQEQHDTKSEFDRLKQLCVKHQIDTSTREQKEKRKGEQRVTKGGRPVNRVPAASTTPPAADDVTPGADA
jgi:hypothetical protein